MATDLVKIVNTVRDDLKKLYLKNPTTLWDIPAIAVAKRDGTVNFLDGIKNDDQVVGWLTNHMQNDMESVIVGRMVAKYSDVLGSDGKPIVKEKAIMIMGRSLNSNRAYVTITPCLEHRDYRGDQFAEKQNKVFDPTLKGADMTKNIVDEETNHVVGRLQAKFGIEQILDSRNGQEFLLDPIIEGVLPPLRGVAEAIIKAEDLNKSTIEKAKGIL